RGQCAPADRAGPTRLPGPQAEPAPGPHRHPAPPGAGAVATGRRLQHSPGAASTGHKGDSPRPQTDPRDAGPSAGFSDRTSTSRGIHRRDTWFTDRDRRRQRDRNPFPAAGLPVRSPPWSNALVTVIGQSTTSHTVTVPGAENPVVLAWGLDTHTGYRRRHNED